MKLYRPATIADGFELIENIRDEDKAEVEAIGAKLSDVPQSLTLSEHPTAVINYKGELAGIAGVVRLSPIEGQIWMLCTHRVYDMKVGFFRQAKVWMEEVETDYRLLWNLADARNTMHHQLLKFLGFTNLRTVTTGPQSLPFYEIVRLCA